MVGRRWGGGLEACESLRESDSGRLLSMRWEMVGRLVLGAGGVGAGAGAGGAGAEKVLWEGAAVAEAAAVVAVVVFVVEGAAGATGGLRGCWDVALGAESAEPTVACVMLEYPESERWSTLACTLSCWWCC